MLVAFGVWVLVSVTVVTVYAAARAFARVLAGQRWDGNDWV